MPSGLATAIMMPIIGSWVQRGVPPQLMTGSGFLIFFGFCFILSKSTLATGAGDFALPLMMRGVGLALLFIPITNMSLRSLAPKDVPQGAGLTNMMRQLGGSFGVAIMATYVGKASWAHRTALLSHLQWTSPDVQARVATLTQGFVAQGSAPTVARQQAYAALEGLVTRQTLLLTYMEAFRIVGIFFLFCIPLLFLVGKAAKPLGVPAAAGPSEAPPMH
jgi:DHA2 family multidrug resistance protein